MNPLQLASRVGRFGGRKAIASNSARVPAHIAAMMSARRGVRVGSKTGVNPLAATQVMASSPSMASAAKPNLQGSMMAGPWRGMGAPSALTGIRAAATSSAGGRMLAGGALGAWTGSDQGTGGMLAGAAAGALLGGAGWNRAAGAVTNMGFTKNWQRMAIGAGGTYFGASAASSMFGNR